ncbi:MAG: 4Fe-4S binding protein [Clostridia bacterium]|nr:4Fe-4S binding protein [Clostridia bacterium]
MKRKIIHIDKDLCNGCGACAAACHEGAIEMVDGKAVLTREDYCDGLGDCLPACPTGAITFEEREAPAYNEAAVLAAKTQKSAESHKPPLSKPSAPSMPAHGMGGGKLPCGCPGTNSKRIVREESACAVSASPVTSRLSQWPVQIKLVPVNAPYFDGANLLIAADCTAYAYGNIHEEFICGRVTLIGCPKLDEEDYAEKLTAIISKNNIKSVTILRMEVPCCGGIENAAKRAIQASGKFLPRRVVTVTTDGRLIE